MKKAGLRTVGKLAIVLALVGAAGCTVRPLYSDAPITSSGQDYGMAAELRSIAIKPVSSRYGQVVRNHLIYMFGQGGGEPAQSKYTLNLTVTALSQGSTYRQVGERQNEPSSATMTLTATYTLATSADGAPVASGRREIMSSYDVPRQSFAAMRAARDAENRAARELAHQLRLAIAQDLSRR